MGLDAVVYCDCFEVGRLREPSPPGCNLEVAADGSLHCGNDELEVKLAFDQWLMDRACEHEDGVLVHHRIGNIALVAALREELARTPQEFPVILNAVLYNGIHCGDFIEYPMLFLLRPEVEALAKVHCAEPHMEQYMREFESQMRELLECALRVRKPISF